MTGKTIGFVTVFPFPETSEQYFTIVVQGRGFNMTLTNDYCIDCANNLFNVTYMVPISKYMSDDYVLLTFKYVAGYETGGFYGFVLFQTEPAEDPRAGDVPERV